MLHFRMITALCASSLLVAIAAQAHKHHDHRKYTLTGGATYLQPSTNLLDYVDYMTTPSSGGLYSVYSEAVQPEFGWGYYLAAAYKIGHHYDVQVSWTQFNSNLTDDHTLTGMANLNTYVITSSEAYNNGLLAGEIFTAESKQNIDYSALDATIGQTHFITEMLDARFFAGFRYAKIDSDIDNIYSNFTDFFVSHATVYDQYNSSFSGFGPELGLDLEYEVYQKLGVVAHFTGALLVGTLEADSTVYNAFDIFSPTNPELYTKTDSVVRMVPAFDAKLGANWSVPYDHDKFAFELEAGYQASFYIDVIDQAQVTAYDGHFEHNYSNYGNMGPYLNVSAMF